MIRLPNLKRIEKLAIDNSPTILTVIGVVGAIGTAVLTHKAATKAEIWRSNEEQKRLDANPYNAGVSKREHFDNTWKFYIPPVVSGTLTIGAIIMANRIGSKRAAAIAAAYAIAERAHSEYAEKVSEIIGSKEEQKVREEIVRDRIRDTPMGESNTVLIGSGDVRCFEMYTGRYFHSSVEEIKKAMNETNYQINADGYASVGDFYHRLGLPRTQVSEEMGWRADKLMDIEFTTILSEDGQPCVAISFKVDPIREYHRFR